VIYNYYFPSVNDDLGKAIITKAIKALHTNMVINDDRDVCVRWLKNRRPLKLSKSLQPYRTKV